MISAAAWIAKGKATRHPTKYAVDDAELERVAKLANVQFEDAKEQLERAQRQIANGDSLDDDDWQDDDDEDEDEGDDAEDDEKMETAGNAEDDADTAAEDDPDGLKKYNLDAYDDEEKQTQRSGPFRNVKGLQYYRNNDEDPYITLKDEQDEELAEEREELEVRPEENFIVCAKTEDDVSLLEAYLYNAADANLYVHHDLMLPSFPLCLEWLDTKPFSANTAERGNFIAVGTMDPEIEIWSMDVVEGLYPDAILGQGSKEPLEKLGTGKKKRRQLKPRVANPQYHVDAVLGLSWNRVARNVLASASADQTIKLWDLHSNEQGKSALRSFDDIHSDKVQSIAWDTSNSAQGAVSQPARLLSGSYDKTLAVFDSRSPADVVRASVAADVEAICWNGWREHCFLVATEDGLVQSFDARTMSSSKGNPTTALFTLSAHDGACTSVHVSPHIPGCILTGGTDKLVKLWNVDEDAQTQKISGISLVTSRNLDAGKIFTAQFSPDDPLTLVAAGSQGSVRVWDTLSNVGVRKTFGQRLSQLPALTTPIDGSEPARGDGVVRLADEADGEDDDDEAGAGDVEMQG